MTDLLKYTLRRSFVILLCLFASAAMELSLFATPPIGSIPPGDLLKALPPVPDDWTCLESLGKRELSIVDTPITVVIREYKVPPPKEEPPTATPPVPGTLNITVMDLGSRGTPTDNPPVSAKAADSFPLALVMGSLQERQNKDKYFSGPIGSRLVVRIVAQNMKTDNFKKILKAFDFTALVNIEKQLPSAPIKAVKFTETVGGKPHAMETIQLDNTYVNELDPKTNRSWKSASVQSSQ